MSAARTPAPTHVADRRAWAERLRGRQSTLRPQQADRDRLILAVSFGASLGLVAAGFVAGIPALRLPGALAALLFGAGTAPLQHRREPEMLTRLGVAGVVALSGLTLIGTVMVLGPLWTPTAAVVVVLVASLGAHLRAVRLLPPGTAASTMHTLSGIRGWFGPSSGCTALGSVLWLTAALSMGHVTPGVGGFLTHISPLWFIGLLLVLVGLATANRRPQRDAAAATVSLLLATTVTAALAYGMPRSQSAAKHIELVRLILREHHLDIGGGIYNAYSGFFAGIAWIASAVHVNDVVGLATFWPVLLGLVRVVELRVLLGRVVSSGYLAWCATAIAILVDAIGADYFSPQSVGFVVALGVFGLVVRGVRPLAVPARVTSAVLLVAGCALAPTHELSPFLIGGVLLILTALGCSVSRLASAMFLVPAVTWALINRNVLSGFFSLSALGRASNFAPPKTVAAPGLERLPIVAESSYALLIGMTVLMAAALIGFARHRRSRWAWAYGLSAGAGLVFVAVNPYGNEGIFRAALFGIPWLAALAAHAVTTDSSVGGRRPQVGLLALLVALLATFLTAQFGMDGTAVERRADLNALRNFALGSVRGSYLTNVGFGDTPSSPPNTVPGRHFVSWRDVRPAPPSPGRRAPVDLRAFTRNYEALALKQHPTERGDLYAVWSPVLATYSRVYGLQTLADSARWRDDLLRSPEWQLVYSANGSFLFRKPRAQRR